MSFVFGQKAIDSAFATTTGYIWEFYAQLESWQVLESYLPSVGIYDILDILSGRFESPLSERRQMFYDWLQQRGENWYFKPPKYHLIEHEPKMERIGNEGNFYVNSDWPPPATFFRRNLTPLPQTPQVRKRIHCDGIKRSIRIRSE